LTQTVINVVSFYKIDITACCLLCGCC